MNIEVLFFGQFRELTGAPRITIEIKDNSSLADLIEHLSGTYGDAFRNKIDNIKGLRILIDGREYTQLGGIQTLLKEGNTIAFLPPIAGG
jgi:MoaD family protein